MRLRKYLVNDDAAGRVTAQSLEAEHDHLHEMVRQFVFSVRSTNFDAASAQLNGIEHFCHTHFQHEEYALRQQPGAERHARDHRQLLSHLLEIKTALVSEPHSTIRKTAVFYTSMITHIDNADRPGLARLLTSVGRPDVMASGWNLTSGPSSEARDHSRRVKGSPVFTTPARSTAA